ncbi:unnamed protein product [Ectocarpus sp. 4 AP-2014]
MSLGLRGIRAPRFCSGPCTRPHGVQGLGKGLLYRPPGTCQSMRQLEYSICAAWFTGVTPGDPLCLFMRPFSYRDHSVPDVCASGCVPLWPLQSHAWRVGLLPRVVSIVHVYPI